MESYSAHDIQRYRASLASGAPDADKALLERCCKTIRQRVESTYAQATSVLFAVEPLMIPMVTLDVERSIATLEGSLKRLGYRTYRVDRSCLLITWGLEAAKPLKPAIKASKAPEVGPDEAWRFA